MEYIERVSGQFTNNPMASVPWTTLSMDTNHEYISADSLPIGQSLLDPSKLQVLQVESIWRKWYERQMEDTQGLIFLKALHKDIRRIDSLPGQSKNRSWKYGMPSDLEPAEDSQVQLKCPHLESPAAHSSSKTSRMSFLKTLSEDAIYTQFVDLLNLRNEVCFICLHIS
jgi:hypothetical protein